VSTSESAAPAARPPATAVGRKAQPSNLRRASGIVLVAGTVLAVGAAFGPTWLVRIGVGVAVAAAVIACALAWKEIFTGRRQHALQTLEASQRHGATLREERTRNGAVVDTLTRRVSDAGAVITGQQAVIVDLRTEVAGLRTEHEDLQTQHAGLQTQLVERDTMITSMRRTVGTQQAELAALRPAEADGETGADVRHMPRRVLAEHESTWGEVPDADELWRDGSHPTVVDLRVVDTAMVLPNYEVDRRVG